MQMNKRGRQVALQMVAWSIGVTVLVSGCATRVSVTANWDKTHSRTIERLLVVSRLVRADRTLARRFAIEIDRCLAELNVAHRIQTVDSLAMNADEHKRELAEYDPDGVLTLWKTGGTVDRFGHYLEIKIFASLFDRPSKKEVWCAEISGSPDAGAIAAALVRQLVADRMIRGLPETARREEASR